MKLISIVIFSLLAVLVNARGKQYDLRDAPVLFLDFVREYNRQYRDTADIVEHYAAFVTNLVQVNKQNSESETAVFGINQFADYTQEELKETRGFGPQKASHRNRDYPPRLRWD